MEQGHSPSCTPPSPAACSRTRLHRHAAQPHKGAVVHLTVYDYPLKQAILDASSKRPLKGIAKGITEQKSEVASTRYQAYWPPGGALGRSTATS